VFFVVFQAGFGPPTQILSLQNLKVGGSGAKEAHAGACSDKRQVLLGLDLSSEAAKIFQAASVASRLRVAQ
jgi:hypothetical protein